MNSTLLDAASRWRCSFYNPSPLQLPGLPGTPGTTALSCLYLLGLKEGLGELRLCFCWKEILASWLWEGLARFRCHLLRHLLVNEWGGGESRGWGRGVDLEDQCSKALLSFPRWKEGSLGLCWGFYPHLPKLLLPTTCWLPPQPGGLRRRAPPGQRVPAYVVGNRQQEASSHLPHPAPLIPPIWI